MKNYILISYKNNDRNVIYRLLLTEDMYLQYDLESILPKEIYMGSEEDFEEDFYGELTIEKVSAQDVNLNDISLIGSTTIFSELKSEYENKFEKEFHFEFKDVIKTISNI